MARDVDSEEMSEAQLDNAVEEARLDAIDATLSAQFDQDDRLGSGVSEEHPRDDLTFIQMTGLTRHDGGDKGEDADMDPNRPVVFVDKGVVDVDPSMGPQGIEGAESVDEEPLYVEPVVHNEASGSSADALKELIADIEGGGDEDAEAEEEEGVAEIDLVDDALLATLSAQAQGIPVENVVTQAEAVVADEVEAVEDSAVGAALDELKAEDVAEENVVADPGEADDEEESGIVMSTLEEAEQLLQAMEKQPREEEVPHDEAMEVSSASLDGLMGTTELDAGVAEVEGMLDAIEEDDVMALEVVSEPAPNVLEDDHSYVGRGVVNKPIEYNLEDAGLGEANDQDEIKPLRRSRNYAHKRMRQIQRLTVVLLVVAGLVLGSWLVYSYVTPMMIGAEDVYGLALEQEAAGKYLLASDTFGRFVAREPDHVLRPDAQYRAASLLMQVDVSSMDARQDILLASLGLFDQFVTQNPKDERVPRGESMMAILYYELGRYEEAINLLQGKGDALSDPDAELPRMRTLARCYGKLGDVAAAESAYLQAVVLSGNFKPEQDYNELGELFRVQGKLAQDAIVAGKFLDMAVKYWTEAVNVMGIDPQEAKRIEQKIEMLKKESGSTGVLMPDDTALNSEDLAPDEEMVEAASSAVVGDYEVNPAEEAAHLVPDGLAVSEEVLDVVEQ